MKTLPIRLLPGQDLRPALEAAVAAQGCTAAFVLSGIGSLAQAHLRFAGADEAQAELGDIEILSLAGTIAPNASHLHATLATSNGNVLVSSRYATTPSDQMSLRPSTRCGVVTCSGDMYAGEPRLS